MPAPLSHSSPEWRCARTGLPLLPAGDAAGAARGRVVVFWNDGRRVKGDLRPRFDLEPRDGGPRLDLETLTSADSVRVVLRPFATDTIRYESLSPNPCTRQPRGTLPSVFVDSVFQAALRGEITGDRYQAFRDAFQRVARRMTAKVGCALFGSTDVDHLRVAPVLVTTGRDGRSATDKTMQRRLLEEWRSLGEWRADVRRLSTPALLVAVSNAIEQVEATVARTVLAAWRAGADPADIPVPSYVATTTGLGAPPRRKACGRPALRRS